MFKRIVFTLILSAISLGVRAGVRAEVNPADSLGAVSPLAAVNVALLGDSNTWIGGDDFGSDRGWSYWFKRSMAPASLTTVARSGATWSHTDRTCADTAEYTEIITDNNVIYNQVLCLRDAVDSALVPTPDLILVWAGTNDAWFAHLRPDAFSRGVNDAMALTADEMLATPPGRLRSLAEAVVLDLRMLQRAFPGAKIVVLTPIPSVKISPEMLADVSGIIADAASRCGASVLRMDLLSPINPIIEATERRLTSDGTHTSPAGARANAEILCRFLSDLYSSRNLYSTTPALTASPR